MSGIEVVGAILGMYPVIVALADTYRNMRGSGSASLSNKVFTASTVYEQTVRSLLASAVSEHEVQQFITAATELPERDQSIWRDPELKQKLVDRLGAEKLEVALEFSANIKTQLDGVRTELDNMRRGTEVLDRFRSKVRTAMANMPQSSIQEKLKRINKLNKELRNLLDDRPIITPFQQQRRPSVPQARNVSAHENSSEEALDFFNAIEAAYTCHCQTAHLASLGCHCAACIEVFGPAVTPPTQDWQFGLAIPRSPETPSDISTVVLLEPTAEEDLAAPTIDDLCSLINDVAEASVEAPEEVREIVSSSKRYKMKVRRIETSKNHSIRCFAELMQPQSGLTTLSRRELALRLSSAIIRLRKTPWIDGSWTWNDVWVSQDTDDDNISKFSILFIPREFYSKAFSSGAASVMTLVNNPPLAQIIDDEPVLTKLGFALIELALGKTIGEIGDEYGFDVDAETAKILTAKQLLKANLIRTQAGQRYEDAVKACISHQYFDQNGNPKGLLLDHPSFPFNVNDAIISPLYCDWQHYGGGQGIASA